MTPDRRIHFLKGLAIIGVLINHVGSSRFLPETSRLLDNLRSLSCWCVLLFLFCAGILHGRSWKRREQSLTAFAWHRTVRLMVPWVALSCVNSLGWILLIRSGVYSTDHGTAWEWGGGQLYFLPMLLLISVAVHGLLLLRNRAMLWIAAWGSLAVAVAVYPVGPFVGNAPSTYWWGAFMYLAGLLTEERLATQRLPTARPLELVGEASGTIFLYHTPFVMSALMVLSAKVFTSPWSQFFGAVGAVVVTLATLTAVHIGLKGTRFKWVLL